MKPKYADLRHRFFTAKTFRDRHQVVGEICLVAERRNMPLDQFVRLHIGIPVTIEVFDLKLAMARRDIVGAPGPKKIAFQLARWRKRLARGKTYNERGTTTRASGGRGRGCGDGRRAKETP